MKSPSETIIHICKDWLSHESSIYPQVLANIFNTYYERIRSRFAFAPQWIYVRINHHEVKYKKRGKELLSPIFIHHHRKTSDSGGRRLTIRFDIFNDPQIRQAILLVEIWRLILSRLFKSPNNALDASFALSWDMIDDPNLKENFSKLWEQAVPVKTIELARAPSLKKYVRNLSKQGPQYYSREIIPRYLGIRKVAKKRPLRFAFIRGPRVSDLTKRQLSVFKAALTLNSDRPSVVSEYLDITESTASKVLQVLKARYFLRTRWSLSANPIGLDSMIALFQVPLSEEGNINKLAFPTTRAYIKFKQIDLLAFYNFYYPSQYYAQKQVDKWKQSLFLPKICSAKMNLVKIGVHEHPIVSNELEHSKINVQRPELFDPVIGSWILGDTLSFKEMATEKNLAKPVKNPPNFGQEERQLAFDIFTKNPRNIDQFLKRRKGNRNRLLDMIHLLMEHRIIRKEVIMPFFDDLERVFITIHSNGNINKNYALFIKEIAARCPISNSTLLKDSVIVSFLAVPTLHKIELLELIRDLFSSAKLAMFPETLESSRKSLQALATKTGWKLQPLPCVQVFYFNRDQ